jgi:hypothetical protein
MSQQRIEHGTASMENADRAAYQSARTPTRDGRPAPLPLTLAEALAEAAAHLEGSHQ